MGDWMAYAYPREEDKKNTCGGRRMTDTLRDIAMAQYGKLEYPVTHEELYCAGFEAGVKFVYNKLREEQLKETERTLNRVLNAFGTWKPEVKE